MTLGSAFHRVSGSLSAVVLPALALLSLSAAPAAFPSRQGPDQLRATAISAFQSGRFAEAERLFQQVLANSPADGSARAGVVRALLKQDRVDEAETAGQCRAANLPTHASLLAACGDVCYRQGDLARALQMYVAGAVRDAGCARAYLGLAKLDLLERRNRTAKGRLEKAHELDPKDPEIVRAWCSTLPTRAQQIDALGRYLEMAQSEDATTVAGARTYLAAMRALGDKKIGAITDPARAYHFELREILGPKGPAQAYWLQVTINGQKLRLELDSGASGILVKRKAAERSHLTMLADGAPLSGVGNEGTRNSSVALADTVRVGDLEMRNVIVKVVPQDLKVLDERDGLVGTDIFWHFLVKADFPGRTLDLTPLGPGQKSIAEDEWNVERQSRSGFTPVHVLGHLLLADTAINGVPGFLMIVDSGAYGHLLSTAAAGRLGRLNGANANVTGISGAARDTLYTAREMSLRFAGVEQPGQFLAVDFAEQNRRAGIEMAGLVGLDALRHLCVIIDYTNGLIRLEYNPR